MQLSLASIYAREAGSELVHVLLQAGKAVLAPHSLGNADQQGLQNRGLGCVTAVIELLGGLLELQAALGVNCSS